MKFRNPWIDPRVVEVRSAAAQAYLRQRGWQSLPHEQPHLLPFEGPPGNPERGTVQVPLREHARDYPQRIIELITDLALAEERYAVDVLNDILQQALAESASANGPNLPKKGEAATR
jgi:hypothetical protein